MPSETTPSSLPLSSKPPREQAQASLEALIKRLVSLPERAMRREVMSEQFALLALDIQIEFLHLLTMRSAVFAEYRIALIAFQDLTTATQPIDYESSRELYKLAGERAYKHVQRLLLSVPPKRQNERPPRGHHQLAEVPLGLRKSLARKQNISTLEKLLLDPDPSVIRMLLQNPRITEKEVLLLSTRRPNQPQILEEIARHPRWFRRQAIQIALCKNPYTPPAIILQYLPSLPSPELLEIKDMAQVHPLTLEAASEILSLRDAARFYQPNRQPTPAQKQLPPLPADPPNESLFEALERIRKKTPSDDAS